MDVRTAKGKESHVDLAAEKPTAGRRGKPATSEQPESVPSKKLLVDNASGAYAKSPVSTRRGKRQVIAAVENVRMQQKGQESAAATRVSGGRRAKHDELQEAVESSKLKTPSRSKKRPQTAKGKESNVDSATDKPVAGRRGKPATSKQLESVPSSSVAAKSLVSTRRGKRQIKETENVKTQEKAEENPTAATVAVGRRAKRGEPEQVVESSNVKTPSRSRKRPLTSEEPVDAPVAKQQRQRTKESLVAEQPIKQSAKQRGKSSVSSEPAEPIVQPDKSRKQTVTKKMSKSVQKKSGGKKANDVEVMDNLPMSLKKSSSRKVDKKLQVVDNLSDSKLKGYKKKKDVKIVVEKEKMAVVSPLATRSKRTKR